MIKQSFTWWSFAGPETDPETLLRRAAEIGFDGVELLDEDLFPIARDMGLEITTHRAHPHIEVGLNRKENHEAIFGAVEAALELAERWQIPNLVCFSGNRDGLGDDEGSDNMADGLRRLAPLAERAGVTLVLELLNSRVDHPGYMADDTAWGVVEKVASPNVKLLYDVYHMQIMEGDLIRTLRAHHTHIGHVHLAGNPGRHEPDAGQEISYPAVLEAFATLSPNGSVGHEFIPTRGAEESLRESFHLVSEAERRARGFAESLFTPSETVTP